MDTLIELFTNHWITIIVAIVVIVILVKLLKLALRLVILAAIVIGLVVLFTDFTLPTSMEEIKEMSTDVKDQITTTAQQETVKLMVNQIDGADYLKEDNGDYTITYQGMVAKGNEASEDVTVYINGEAHTMRKSEAIQWIRTYLQE
ncbi:hypothetical protein [Bacillus sp. FJAT-45350]|uniref:hypothetical protein n=1 Tax=Bacillus sp. FJAT-45350 TaxID=2011014 RepID=UPI000BB9A95C|nr:hypothetical protein [Bacillus sp. FJAT-45350]